MKRIMVFVLVGALLACASLFQRRPVVAVLEAQTLPITKTLVWDANPASDEVTGYRVTLDGAVIGSPAGTSQPFTITALGPHTLSVVAVNLWGESPPASLAFTVVSPGKSGNLKIQ